MQPGGDRCGLGEEAEKPAGVNENDALTKAPGTALEFLQHAEKGFARIDRIQEKPCPARKNWP